MSEDAGTGDAGTGDAGPVGEVPDPPDLGSPHVVAGVRGRVLRLRIDRTERRNAFTQDMYRAIKRAAVWADEQPELVAQIARTGPQARAAVKRELNARLAPPDVALFHRAIRSPEMTEGMAAFVEKRPPAWPR